MIPEAALGRCCGLASWTIPTPYRCMQAMQQNGGGSIVLTSAAVGEMGVPHFEAMGAAKAGVEGNMKFWQRTRHSSLSLYMLLIDMCILLLLNDWGGSVCFALSLARLSSGRSPLASSSHGNLLVSKSALICRCTYQTSAFLCLVPTTQAWLAALQQLMSAMESGSIVWPPVWPGKLMTRA